jgi:hypothetical protein
VAIHFIVRATLFTMRWVYCFSDVVPPSFFISTGVREGGWRAEGGESGG